MMMRRFMIAGSFVLVAANAAWASPPVWQGEFFVTAVTPTCVSTGDENVGDFGRIVYRPIINKGDPAESLVVFFDRSTNSVTSTEKSGSLHGKATVDAVAINGHAETFSYKPTSDLIITPTTVTTTTKEINITGTVTNWYNVAGCTVTLNAALLPRP